MGWGSEPHEGFAEQRRDDGRWTGHLVADAVAQRAACSCGWRGETVHPAPAAPALDSPE